MLTIHKFKLMPGITKLIIPKTATILTVQMQGDQPTVWVLLNTDHTVTERTLETYGTGHEVLTDIELKYISTFQMGPLVWHAFERIK